MLLTPFLPLVYAITTESEPVKGMTLQEARERIPQRKLPPFWVGDMEQVAELLANVQRGEVRTLTATPGRRALQIVAYGQREPVAH
ncbi:MAG: hypothetical protein ACUVX8_17910, partial [Candidatus Zipacnadales bacterium]